LGEREHYALGLIFRPAHGQAKVSLPTLHGANNSAEIFRCLSKNSEEWASLRTSSHDPLAVCDKLFGFFKPQPRAFDEPLAAINEFITLDVGIDRGEIGIQFVSRHGRLLFKRSQPVLTA